LRHEQRHVATPLGREAHDYGGVVRHLDADEIAQVLGDERVTLVLEQIEREGHVMRGEP
jgi:hypothetical protein